VVTAWLRRKSVVPRPSSIATTHARRPGGGSPASTSPERSTSALRTPAARIASIAASAPIPWPIAPKSSRRPSTVGAYVRVAASNRTFRQPHRASRSRASSRPSGTPVRRAWRHAPVSAPSVASNAPSVRSLQARDASIAAARSALTVTASPARTGRRRTSLDAIQSLSDSSTSASRLNAATAARSAVASSAHTRMRHSAPITMRRYSRTGAAHPATTAAASTAIAAHAARALTRTRPRAG